MNFFLDKLRKFDWLLVVAVFLLFSLGLSAIYSVGLNQEFTGASSFEKQVVFGVIGFVVFLFLGIQNYSLYRVSFKIIWSIMVLLLLLVLFFGEVLNGTKGWFVIFGLGFQPVELAKIVLIISLAKFFSNRYQQFFVLKHLIVSLLITLSLVIFVLFQPDFGSALVLLGIWFIMLLLTGINKKILFILGLIALILMGISWQLFLADYQKDRLAVFLDPARDPLGSGYNVTQATIAIGSGTFFGRGLGFGSQSQLKFIPEAQTDFLFAVIAEELGFFGVVLVFSLWFIIFWRLAVIARSASDDFGQFLVLGVMAVWLIHLIVNAGMNLGIMPVMGISLPFLSYGGSFLLVCLSLLGIVQSVAVKR